MNIDNQIIYIFRYNNNNNKEMTKQKLQDIKEDNKNSNPTAS